MFLLALRPGLVSCISNLPKNKKRNQLSAKKKAKRTAKIAISRQLSAISQRKNNSSGRTCDASLPHLKIPAV